MYFSYFCLKSFPGLPRQSLDNFKILNLTKRSCMSQPCLLLQPYFLPLSPLRMLAQPPCSLSCVFWTSTALSYHRALAYATDVTSSLIFSPSYYSGFQVFHSSGPLILCSHCTWLITFTTLIPVTIIFVCCLHLLVGWKWQETCVLYSVFLSSSTMHGTK